VLHWPKGNPSSSRIGTSGDIFTCVIPRYEEVTVLQQGMYSVGSVFWFCTCLDLCV